MFMKTQLINKLGAFASLVALEQMDFERFQSYEDDDFKSRLGIPVSIQMIYELTKIVDALCEQGEDADCVVDFLVDPSHVAFQTLKSNFEIHCTRREALGVVLQNRVQHMDWDEVLQDKRPLESVVGNLMHILEELELLYWEDLGDAGEFSSHELTALYPSFGLFCAAALNVYADNTGFDEDFDSEHLRSCVQFLREMIGV